MPAVSALDIAADLSYVALNHHVRGKAIHQTMQERPLLALLNGTKKTFSGGRTYITENIQGDTMFGNGSSGFLQGVTTNSQLTFAQSDNVIQPQFAWKEMHAGFVISQTELKQDGIIVTDGEHKTKDTGAMLTRITGILENRLADFTDSWSRAINDVYWRDGSQDANQVAGIKSLIVENPTAGTVGGLSQATHSFWRSRANLTLAPSAANQTISKFLRNEVIQLTRYGGKPNKGLCGSLFWDALSQEVEAKGIYTQSGFTGNNDIGMQKISIKGIGTFEYDPTLDQLGEAKRCYIFDTSAIKKRPMEGAENLVLKPARPYDYLVMLQSMMTTEALTINRLTGCAVYGIA